MTLTDLSRNAREKEALGCTLDCVIMRQKTVPVIEPLNHESELLKSLLCSFVFNLVDESGTVNM